MAGTAGAAASRTSTCAADRGGGRSRGCALVVDSVVDSPRVPGCLSSREPQRIASKCPQHRGSEARARLARGGSHAHISGCRFVVVLLSIPRAFRGSGHSARGLDVWCKCAEGRMDRDVGAAPARGGIGRGRRCASVVDSVVDSARFPSAQARGAPRVREGRSRASARNLGSARGTVQRYSRSGAPPRPVALSLRFVALPAVHGARATPRRIERLARARDGRRFALVSPAR